jgi:hypothetical protein
MAEYQEHSSLITQTVGKHTEQISRITIHYQNTFPSNYFILK